MPYHLSSCAGRIRFLLGTPGMVALDLDATLKGLFQRIVQHLENIPKPQGENISAITCDLSELRKDWLSILMIVTSARSSINIRHLEKATVSTGKEGLLSEGNAAYNWSRCVDELETQLSKYGSLKKLYFYHQHLTTVTKIGRDAVLYVESLIESIMGGLEGLINILDSEGGFGSLEMQLLPDQAANLMNLTSRLSHPSAKSPKASYGFHLPGYESYPENNNSIKMLEAAMQREYMRECILGNFKRRLLTVLKTDSDLQRPSVLESLIRRHTSIVHLAEQHVSMDLTQGIREILLAETYSGPVSSLQLFEKPTEQLTGSATEAVCNWYIENIVKDVSGAGILFAPLHRCFKSTRPVGGYFAESVTDLRELKAFVRTFGSYGVDRLDRMLKEHTAALLNCIDTTLRANRENLEAVAGSMHSGDRMETEANVKQIVDMDTMVRFCIQAGQAIAFDSLLAEASGVVLEEGAPLIYSLLAGVATHLPDEVPEKKEIRRMRRVANTVNVVGDHDFEWIRSILERCICAVIAGSEFVRLEREYQQKQSLSNGHITESLEPETQNYMSIEASIKSTMQLFIKFSAGIILDSWSESTRIIQILTPLALLGASPRHSPAMSLAHASPSLKQPRGDATPQSNVNDSGYFKPSSTHGQDQYEAESFSIRSIDNKQRNVRRSGPLDYSLSRKAKFIEGSTSASTGPSPLPRFAVSRSGPISYKNINTKIVKQILYIQCCTR
ncbi:protein NAP1 [Sesamum angolense]|uniref:Protein NAP1 n=1 Tax=Sesamum angolense TaxID=2727404 RepID=A0AAE1WTS4_9LAMI|nr:protein NAP1 [Sesamum angolense]